jgi:hypothetical protein
LVRKPTAEELLCPQLLEPEAEEISQTETSLPRPSFSVLTAVVVDPVPCVLDRVSFCTYVTVLVAEVVRSVVVMILPRLSYA